MYLPCKKNKKYQSTKWCFRLILVLVKLFYVSQSLLWEKQDQVVLGTSTSNPFLDLGDTDHDQGDQGDGWNQSAQSDEDNQGDVVGLEHRPFLKLRKFEWWNRLAI